MDLDERGRRAARRLTDRVQADLDVGRARVSFDRAAVGRRDRTPRLVGAGLIATAVLLVGGLMVVAGGADGPGRVRTDEDGLDDREATEAKRVFEVMPAGPIDGRASWRLPVVAEPQAGVTDGDTVKVYGRGFEPDEYLGIVQCSSEADTASAGVAACQLSSGPGDSFGAVTYAYASREGTVVADFVVHRFIETPSGGKIDCRSGAERCLIGMGAVSNYDQSGGSYINFAGAPLFPEPKLALGTPAPFASGQQVQVLATALVPGRQTRIQQCQADRCRNLVDGVTDASGTFTAPVVLTRSFTDDQGHEVACGDECEVRLAGIGVKGASSAPFPDPVGISFTDQNVPIVSTTTTTTTITIPPPGSVPPGTGSTTPGSVPPGTGSTPPGPATPGTTVPLVPRPPTSAPDQSLLPDPVPPGDPSVTTEPTTTEPTTTEPTTTEPVTTTVPVTGTSAPPGTTETTAGP